MSEDISTNLLCREVSGDDCMLSLLRDTSRDGHRNSLCRDTDRYTCNDDNRYMIVDMFLQRQCRHKLAIMVACRHCKNKTCMGVSALVSLV